MSTLGFDRYVEPLKLYLLKYRESMKGDKPGKGGDDDDDDEDEEDGIPMAAPTSHMTVISSSAPVIHSTTVILTPSSVVGSSIHTAVSPPSIADNII